MAQGLGGVVLSMGSDTAATRQFKTHSGICHVYSGIYSFAVQAHETHAVKHRENIKSQLFFCHKSLSQKYKGKRSLLKTPGQSLVLPQRLHSSHAVCLLGYSAL